MISHRWKRVTQSKSLGSEIVAVLSLRVQMSRNFRSVKSQPYRMATGTGKRSSALAAATKAIRSAARSQARTRIIAWSPQGETKYFDTSFAQTLANAADWTGTEVPCTNYIQNDGTTLGAYTDAALIPSAIGAGYGNVVGSKYHLKKMRVRGELRSAVAADQADIPLATTARVLLVMDTRPNGAQAQGEEVMADMGTSAQNNFNFLAMGAGQGGRFRILKDEIVQLQPSSAGTDGASTNSAVNGAALFNFTWKPSKTLEVLLKANSASPTVASLSSHNIFLLAHSNATVIGTVISGCARCYYEG